MIHCRRRANVQTEAHAILPARSRRWVLWAVLAMTLAAVPAHAQPYVYALGYEPTPNSAFARLVAINAATNAIVGSVALGENPGPRNEHLAMSPDGSRIFVVNSSDRTVSVVSAQTLAILDTYTQALLGIRPGAVTVSSDSSRVYVSGTAPVNGQDQAFVSVIDIAARSRVGTVQLGTPAASGLAASPDGSRALRAHHQPTDAQDREHGHQQRHQHRAARPDEFRHNGRAVARWSVCVFSTLVHHVFYTWGDGGARHHDRDDCRESDNWIRAATRCRLAERRGRLCAELQIEADRPVESLDACRGRRHSPQQRRIRHRVPSRQLARVQWPPAWTSSSWTRRRMRWCERYPCSP